MVTFGVIALVALLGILVYAVGFQQNTAIGGAGDSGSDGGTRIVTSATTLDANGIDALLTGTTVAGTTYISVDGKAFQTGITSADQGDELDVLYVNATAYHSAYVPDLKVPTGKTIYVFDVPFYKNASVTMTMFSTNNDVLTNTATGGAVNQTISSGQTVSLDLRIDGEAAASTQDMTCVIELNGTAVKQGETGVKMSGLGAVYKGQSVPSFYTLSSTANKVWVYDVAPISDGESETGTITIASETSKDLSESAFRINCYTKEHFRDSTTGVVTYDIADSQGTKQSIATYSYAFWFK